MTRSIRPDDIKEQLPVASRSSADYEKTPIVPVPADAPQMRFRHPVYGAPTQTWPYHDAQGGLLCRIARFDYIEDGKSEKQIMPLTFCQLADGKRAWRAKGLSGLRPLYRLPEIIRRNKQKDPAKVLVCEGEKAADAAAKLFPDCVCTTPMHGAQSPAKTDWSSLKGATVVIVPDPDKAGRDFAKHVHALLKKAGVSNLQLLRSTLFSSTRWENGAARPLRWWERKKGYDLADAVEDGWTAERVNDLGEVLFEAYSDQVVDDLRWTQVKTHENEFRFDEESVEMCRTDKEGNSWWQRISSRIVTTGRARSPENERWGHLVELRDPDGKDKQLIIAGELFAGDGKAVREVLLSAGAWIAQDRQSREALLTYITGCVPPKRQQNVPRPGWHGGTFILPDQAFGAASDEKFMVGDGTNTLFACGGTLKAWQDGIARPALGNSRLVFALSIAFVGPLLQLMGAESGIFHIGGPSSSGKSLAQKLAASVWGKGHTDGFVRTWRSTDNALEYVAEAHTDTLLVLDELGMVDPIKVGEISYMISQNAGKDRSKGEGGLSAKPKWRICVLSSGEVGIEDVIEASGPKRAKAGQVLRFVTVPAEAGRGMGIFETLHGCATPGELWEEMKGVAETHYGHASRAYLEALLGMGDNVVPFIQSRIKAFVAEHCGDQANGQIQRVAAKFGLVAAAGELATSKGILPWPEGTASSAIATCFKAWRDERDGNLSEEEREALRAVRGFIEAHGASRFEVIDEQVEVGLDRHIPNRAGFRRRVDKMWEYYVLPEAWRLLCHNMNPKMVARILHKHNLLEVGEEGRLQKNLRLPGISGTTRCYVIKPNLLADPEPPEADDPGEQGP